MKHALLRTFHETAHDFRWTLTLFRRDVAFTVMSVLILSLGIGSTVAVFHVLSAVALRVPAVSRPGELVVVRSGDGSRTITYREFAHIRSHAQSFADVGGYSPYNVGFTYGTGPAEEVRAEVVAGGYFGTLGVAPLMGRVIGEDGDTRSVVVLAERFWRMRFRQDKSVIGELVRLNGHAFEVIGVAAERFQGLTIGTPVDMWVPVSSAELITAATGITERLSSWIVVVARLSAGSTLEQAQAELDVLARRAFEGTPRPARPLVLDSGSLLWWKKENHVASRNMLLVLLGGAAVVLLIACANTSNLLLARGIYRRPEAAIRSALGASRGRLARLFLTESVALFGIAGFFGIVLSMWVSRYIEAFELPGVPLGSLDLRPDVPLIGVGLALAVLAGVASGVLPAIRLARTPLSLLLGGLRVGMGHSDGKAFRRVSIAQLAVAIVVLVMAGSFVRSMQAALRQPLGFEPVQVLAGSLNLGLLGYSDDQTGVVYDRVLGTIRGLPSVEAASLCTHVPLSDVELIRPVAPDSAGATTGVHFAAVSEDYFRTLRIALVDGRDFSGRDDRSAPPVAMVNEAFVQAYWPGQRAVGRRVRLAAPDQVVEIVGVTANVRDVAIDRSHEPFIYTPIRQSLNRQPVLLLRVKGDVASTLLEVRREIQRVNPQLPLMSPRLLEDNVNRSLARERTGAILLSSLGGLAVLLSGLGIYTVVTAAFNRRTRDLAVRMAMGATAAQLAAGVGRQALGLILPALILGNILAFVVRRYVAGSLGEDLSFDPSPFIVASAVIALVTAAACVVPFVRTVRLEPTTALRDIP